jgi:hypothetical protein
MRGRPLPLAALLIASVEEAVPDLMLNAKGADF